MDLGLKGKRALVLGGGTGIGRGIADALAGEGAEIAIVSRNQAVLDQTAGEITGRTGSRVIAIAGDLGQQASIEAAFHAVVQTLGGVDILVNNSGGPPLSGAGDVKRELWQQYFESMVLNIIGLTDLALPAMRTQKWGRVLTVASAGVIQPIPIIGMSNTLRSALVGWSKTLSGEVARDGVTMNMLLPGRIATQRIIQSDTYTAERTGKTVAEVTAHSLTEIPAGRLGTIEEFGAVAAFLASQQASYVTGSVIRIDGGSIKSV